MKYILSLVLASLFLRPVFCRSAEDNKALAAFFQEASEGFYKLFPLAATSSGNYRYWLRWKQRWMRGRRER